MAGLAVQGGDAQALNPPEIERLIDSLTEVNAPTAGLHGSAWASEFMAVNETPVFTGGILGSARPVTDQTMRRLVQLGTQALPSLLAHLGDARESHLVIKHANGFGGMWHAQEYDPRQRAKPYAQLVDLTIDTKEGVQLTTYTVRVGDICYVLIGQIVNREFSAVRYQPSACIIINSPVQSPALAAACRKDWQGLSPEEHANLLIQDSKQDRLYFTALKRLCYYYPETGKSEAVELLTKQAESWDLAQQTRLIKALQPFGESAFDEPIHALFKKAYELKPKPSASVDHSSGFWYLDNLAAACAQRLAGKGHADDYRRYLNERIHESGGQINDQLRAIQTALEKH